MTTGLMSAARLGREQRLTKGKKTGEGPGLDTSSFLVGGYKFTDSVSQCHADFVLGRRSLHTSTYMDTRHVHIHTEFVCVCNLGPKESPAHGVETENSHEKPATTRTANAVQHVVCNLSTTLLLSRYHNGTTTVREPTVVVPSWYHGRYHGRSAA